MVSSRFLEKSGKECVYIAVSRLDAVIAFDCVAVLVLTALDLLNYYLWLDSN